MRGHGEKILPGGCKEQFEKKKMRQWLNLLIMRILKKKTLLSNELVKCAKINCQKCFYVSP